MKRRDLLRAGALAPLVTALPDMAARDPAVTDMTWLTGKWKGEGSFMEGGPFLNAASRIILKSIPELQKE